jgi:signal transduction histidine kinase
MAKTNILVIEDEPDIRESIDEMLGYEGMAVITAENGDLGARLAREFLPDLIICDIMLPGLNGYGVLTTLRNDPLTANIPFIFLTAKADRPSMRYGMELGADDYLTKPFSSDELIAAIRTRLEKKARLVDEYANQAKDLRLSLLHTLPHELRTPLVGIIGGAEMLLSAGASLDQETITSMADMILHSGKRLQRQIENYLLYAQLEIIKTDPERLEALRRAETDYLAALVTAAATAKAALVGRSEDLALSVQESAVSLSAANLKKIVEELVDNAFKFSEPGKRVTVSGEASTRDGSYMLIVSDNGRGMTVDQIKQVGAFVQFGRKLYEQQGSGLGLAIARQLVEFHGGELHIQSELERGTRVHVTLPVPDRQK